MSWSTQTTAAARAQMLARRRSDEVSKAMIEAIREMLGLDPLYANDMGPRPPRAAAGDEAQS